MYKDEIEKWLKKYRNIKYTIRPNLVVDVNGNATSYNRYIPKGNPCKLTLPITFCAIESSLELP